MLVRNALLALLAAFSAGSDTANKFGIGCYADTPGSPTVDVQLDGAAALTGHGGWVVLYLCSWREGGAGGRSCMNASTTRDPASEQALRSAYARGLRVVARIGYPYTVRDHADDAAGAGATATPHPSSGVGVGGVGGVGGGAGGAGGEVVARVNYTSLAAAYARLVGSLPPPPDGAPLYVNVGNEFNACNEWRCSAPASAAVAVPSGGGGALNMSGVLMAQEVAAFSRDVAAALAPLRAAGGGSASGGGWRPGQLRLAHQPLANWQTPPCRCGDAASLGPGEHGLVFLQNMLAAQPALYGAPTVDWLSSHSYPYSMAPWGSDKAHRGLTYYANETALIAAAQGRPPAEAPLPVVITETGWKSGALPAVGGAAAMANYTALAFEQLWLPDDRVIGVCPFLLAGKFWEPGGFQWANVTASGALAPRPVFATITQLRCKVVGGAGC